MPDRDLDLFLLGLFSLIDAMVDRPMGAVISKLALDGEVKEALLGDNKSHLAKIFALYLAYEHGDWDQVAALCQQLKICAERVTQLYLDAIRWSDQTLAA